jgi:molybdate transport system substrate-binding protein
MRALSLTWLFLIAPLTLAGQVHIAVAANFKQTAGAINTLFQNETGHRVTLSSASTGTLYSQITHGAPFDIFLAADSQSTAQLEEAGHSPGGARFCYARGSLILLGRDSLAELGNPKLSLAVANPITAPYGRAAMEVLSRPEYLAGSQRKLVRASNVVQAYQYWYSKAVNLAIVARSLAPDSGVAIPRAWHAEIIQEGTLLTRGRSNPAAKSYLAFLETAAVQTLIADAGYSNCQ